MPNHVYTRLHVSGPDADVVNFTIKSSSSTGELLSFQELMPMPKQLSVVSSPVRIVTQEDYDKAVAEDALLPEKDYRKGYLPLTRQMQADYLEQFGADNWYDWKIVNWGTKWGAYDVSEWTIKPFTGASITYQTAWSPATKLFLKVSKDFPTLTFRHDFVDEGGNFVGYETFRNGVAIDSADYEWNSDEGRATCELVGFKHYEEDDES